MGTQFGSFPAPPGEATVSQAQLHGKACIRCGDARGLLVPSGFRYTACGDSGELAWAVVACAQHLGGRS